MLGPLNSLRDWPEGEAMSKAKKFAEEQVADEANRKALNPNAARQPISDSQGGPKFQETP
jgi:hypothetical protein